MAVGVSVGIEIGVAAAAGVAVDVTVGSGPEQAKAVTSIANMMGRNSLRVIASHYSLSSGATEPVIWGVPTSSRTHLI